MITSSTENLSCLLGVLSLGPLYTVHDWIHIMISYQLLKMWVCYRMQFIWKCYTQYKIKSSLSLYVFHHCVANKCKSHQKPEHFVCFLSLLSITVMPNSKVKTFKQSCETEHQVISVHIICVVVFCCITYHVAKLLHSISMRDQHLVPENCSWLVQEQCNCKQAVIYKCQKAAVCG
jgi:hypothetical protein